MGFPVPTFDRYHYRSLSRHYKAGKRRGTMHSPSGAHDGVALLVERLILEAEAHLLCVLDPVTSRGLDEG